MDPSQKIVLLPLLADILGLTKKFPEGKKDEMFVLELSQMINFIKGIVKQLEERKNANEKLSKRLKHLENFVKKRDGNLADFTKESTELCQNNQKLLREIDCLKLKIESLKQEISKLSEPHKLEIEKLKKKHEEQIKILKTRHLSILQEKLEEQKEKQKEEFSKILLFCKN